MCPGVCHLSIAILLLCIHCYRYPNGYPISMDMNCKRTHSSKVACSFTFTNKDDDIYYLLKRNTPLEGLVSPFITVSHDGVPLKYEGIIVNYAPLSRDEFVPLKPGDSVTATVEITDVYAFTSDGLYAISYINPLQIMTQDEMKLQSFEAVATRKIEVRKTVFINMEDTHLLSRPVAEEQPKGETVYIESCSTATLTNGGTDAQKAVVIEVHGKLCNQFGKAKAAVKNDAVYVTWFGVYTTTRSNKVKDILQECKTGITNNTVTYNMFGSLCQPYYNAYRDKRDRIPKIYLCPRWHNVLADKFCRKSDGEASKESVLAHEWTHVFGNTKDYGTYGAGPSKEMARNDPDKAVNHADSYEYYYCLAA